MKYCHKKSNDIAAQIAHKIKIKIRFGEIKSLSKLNLLK